MKIKKIKKFAFTNWKIIAIIVLALFLRVYKLSSVPPHLTADEAAFGYNAYSVLKTGLDIHGDSFPLIFKSFGDYRPGLYFYLTIPFILIFNLTEFAVRLPNALIGGLTPLVIYFLSKELFPKRERLALIVSFLIAINPWHIHFSRGAWEPNVALFLTLLGIYYFFKAFKNQKLLIASLAFFSLTLLTYQGSKMSSAVVVFILFILFGKRLIRFKKKYLSLAFVAGFIIALPIIFSLFQGKAGRLGVLSVFSYRRPAEYLEAQLNQGEEEVGSLSYYLFHSESFNFTRGIMSRWFNHFSARFLFFEGDWQNQRHSYPNQGMVIFPDLLLIALGLMVVFRKLSRKGKFLLLWLLLAPLPSALSRDQVHAVRSLNMVIPLVFLAALGAEELLSKKNFKTLVFGGVYLVFYVFFLDSYFVHLSKHNSKSWYWGHKQVVDEVSPIQGNYKKIVMQQSFEQPFIFFLFYQKYDPVEFQKQLVFSESKYGDVGLFGKLDNIEFREINWPQDRKDSGVLYIADPIKIPPEETNDQGKFNVISEIKYLDEKETVFRLVEVK